MKITYLAPAKPFKGFDILKAALDELWEEGHRNFELNIFSLTNKVSPYMNMQDGYKYEELERIFDWTDILIAPSVCYETFGFTVLEALSYGVPVLVSENVGAKDIINNEGVRFSVEDDLKTILENLIEDRRQLKIINTNSVNSIQRFDFNTHLDEISQLYVESKNMKR